MSSSALANRYSARMGDALGGAFHVTCGKSAKHRSLRASPRRNWWREPVGAALRGIRSMGQDESSDEDFATQPATLARYGAGVAFNGTFTVFDVILFYEVKSIWIGKCNEGRCLDIENVKRAYSKCVENHVGVVAAQDGQIRHLRPSQFSSFRMMALLISSLISFVRVSHS